MTKFMQQMKKEQYSELARFAKKRSIGVQELIRAVIVPEWLEKERVRVAELNGLLKENRKK